jgi:hypothetical protein
LAGILEGAGHEGQVKRSRFQGTEEAAERQQFWWSEFDRGKQVSGKLQGHDIGAKRSSAGAKARVIFRDIFGTTKVMP